MSAPGKTEPTELILRARTGDADAWGDLYREYAPAIFRFCRRAMPTREDAEAGFVFGEVAPDARRTRPLVAEPVEMSRQRGEGWHCRTVLDRSNCGGDP